MTVSKIDQPITFGSVSEQIVRLLDRANGAMRKSSIYDRLPTKPAMVEFNKAFDALRSSRALVQDNVGGMIVYRLPKTEPETPAAELDTPRLSAMQRQRMRRATEGASGGAGSIDEDADPKTRNRPALEPRRSCAINAEARAQEILRRMQSWTEPQQARALYEPMGIGQPDCSQILRKLEALGQVHRFGAGGSTRWGLKTATAAAPVADAAPVTTPERTNEALGPEEGAQLLTVLFRNGEKTLAEISFRVLSPLALGIAVR